MAMSLRLEDDCLAPVPKLKVDYTGPNPIKVYQVVRGLLIKIFEVSGKDVWERDFRWDATTDPRGFFIRVYADKPLDARTSIFVETTFQGFQPSDPNKNGKVTILIGAKMRTEYKLDSAFKRLPIYSGITKLGGLAEVGGLLWLYHKIFYAQVRRDYIRNHCNKRLETLWRELREVLGMPVPESVF